MGNFPHVFFATPIQGAALTRNPANLEKDPGEVLRQASYAGTTSPMDIAVNEAAREKRSETGSCRDIQIALDGARSTANSSSIKLIDAVDLLAKMEDQLDEMYTDLEGLVNVGAKKTVIKNFEAAMSQQSELIEKQRERVEFFQRGNDVAFRIMESLEEDLAECEKN